MRTTEQPGARTSRRVLAAALSFWAFIGVTTGIAAELTSPEGSSEEALALRPSHRGQDDIATGVADLETSGVTAGLSGSAALGKVGFAIIGREVEAEPGGTIVAHAVTADVVARTEPRDDAERISTFANPSERGGPLVFQATGPRTDDGWLEVLLPVRPNGTTGWIRRTDVDLTRNPYRIEVDASTYSLTIFNDDEVQMTTEIAVGNGATPTPIGDFYLVELLRPSNRYGVYGPYAYGLSGYSDTLDSFNGGQGVIGIHGTNRPDLLGQDVSHGCIRVENPTIEEMVRFLPLGTPVSIFRSEPEAATGSEPVVAGPA